MDEGRTRNILVRLREGGSPFMHSRASTTAADSNFADEGKRPGRGARKTAQTRLAPHTDREQISARDRNAEVRPELLVKCDEIASQISAASLVEACC